MGFVPRASEGVLDGARDDGMRRGTGRRVAIRGRRDRDRELGAPYGDRVGTLRATATSGL